MTVKLTMLGTESGQTGCPTLFATDRGTYVVQGWRVEDEETLGRMDIPGHESCVEVPAALSDYQRFGLAQAAINDAAGEEIRYLDRASAPAAGLPGYGYWVFDEQAVGVLEFNGRGDLLGAHVVHDPAFVTQHLAWLHAAWPVAVPYREFREAHRANRGRGHRV